MDNLGSDEYFYRPPSKSNRTETNDPVKINQPTVVEENLPLEEPAEVKTIKQ